MRNSIHYKIMICRNYVAFSVFTILLSLTMLEFDYLYLVELYFVNMIVICFGRRLVSWSKMARNVSLKITFDICFLMGDK